MNPAFIQNVSFFANRNTPKNMQVLDENRTVLSVQKILGKSDTYRPVNKRKNKRKKHVWLPKDN